MLSWKNVLQSVWNITTDNFLFVQFNSIPLYCIPVCYQPHSTTATECIFRYLLIIRTSVITVWLKLQYTQLQLAWFFQLFTYLSPQFFFPYTVTVLLIWHAIYFLTFMHQFYSFFIHFRRKTRQYSLRADTRNILEEKVMDLRIGIEQVPRLVGTRAVPSNILARRRRRNGTETFLLVGTYPFKYTWENFTERWRSATERKRDV
jgi:hypothetical protein